METAKRVVQPEQREVLLPSPSLSRKSKEEHTFHFTLTPAYSHATLSGGQTVRPLTCQVKERDVWLVQDSEMEGDSEVR